MHVIALVPLVFVGVYVAEGHKELMNETFAVSLIYPRSPLRNCNIGFRERSLLERRLSSGAHSRRAALIGAHLCRPCFLMLSLPILGHVCFMPARGWSMVSTLHMNACMRDSLNGDDS